MLSYQHSYHAGNFADVHKHLALVMLLRYLQRKPAPLCYVDCHAGRGLYDLEGEEARKTGDAATGILSLAPAGGENDALRDYLDLVGSFNPDGKLRYYPGSAALARAVLRDEDRCTLLELHPQEHLALKRFIGNDRRASVHQRDCYEGLPALLPPAIRRGLVLIDPSYEMKDEYEDVVTLLSKALRRWSNAVYLAWYPILAAGRHEAMLDGLSAIAPTRTLISELRYLGDGPGLRGSGLIVVNTPWQFDEQFRAAMDPVRRTLPAPAVHALRWLAPA